MNKICRNVLFLILCIFFVSYYPQIVPGQETYQFQNKFTSDESLYLSLKTDMKGVNQNGKKEYPISRILDAVMLFHTNQVEQGTASVSKYLVDIYATDPDHRFPVITLKTLMGKDLILSPTAFEPAVLSPYLISSIKINTQGKVLDQAKPGMSSQNLQKSIQATTERQPWILFPAEPIVQGATWEEEQQVPLPVTSRPITTQVEYTLKQVREENGQKIATIAYTQDITANDAELNSDTTNKNVHLKLQIKYNQYSIHASGTIEFNMDKGYITSFQSTSNLLLDMQTEADLPDVNFPSQTIMKVTSKTAGTISPAFPARLLTQEKENDEK